MATVARQIPVNGIRGPVSTPRGKQTRDATQPPFLPLSANSSAPPVAKKPKKKYLQTTPPPAPERSSSISILRRTKISKNDQQISEDLSEHFTDFSSLDRYDRQQTHGATNATEANHPVLKKKTSSNDIVTENSSSNRVLKIHSAFSKSQPQLDILDQKSLLKPKDRIKSILIGSNDEEEDGCDLVDGYGSSYNASLMKISHGDVQKHTVAVTTPVAPLTSPMQSRSGSEPDLLDSQSRKSPIDDSREKFLIQTSPSITDSTLINTTTSLNTTTATTIVSSSGTEPLNSSLSDPIAKAYRQHLLNKMELKKTNGSSREDSLTRSLEDEKLSVLTSQMQGLDMPDSACYPRILSPPIPSANLSNLDPAQQQSSSNSKFSDGQRVINPFLPMNHSKAQHEVGSGQVTWQLPDASYSPSYAENGHFEQFNGSPKHGRKRAGSASEAYVYGTLPRHQYYQPQAHISSSMTHKEKEDLRNKAKSTNNLSHGRSQTMSSSTSYSQNQPFKVASTAAGAIEHGRLNSGSQNNHIRSASTSSSSSGITTPASVTSSSVFSAASSSQQSSRSPHGNPDFYGNTAKTMPQQKTSSIGPKPSALEAPNKRGQGNHSKTKTLPSKKVMGSVMFQRSNTDSRIPPPTALKSTLHPVIGVQSDRTVSNNLVAKRPTKSANPNQFSLFEYVSYHASHFPKRVQVTRGLRSESTELNLSHGETFDLHFVRKTKSVIMSDADSIQYTIPMCSLTTFSILYDPFEAEKVANLGFNFKTAGVLMDLKNPPVIISSTEDYDGGNTESSVEKGEVLVFQGVKNAFHGRLLKVFSTKMNMTKYLDSQCTANFTTDPAKIKMDLHQIYNYSIQLPQKAVMYPTAEMEKYIPQSMLAKAVVLKEFVEMKTVIATAVVSASHTRLVKCPMLDIAVSLDVDIQEVRTSETEQAMAQKLTQSLINTFDESSLIPYIDMPSSSSHNAQSLLLTQLDPTMKFYRTEILPPIQCSLPKVRSNSKSALNKPTLNKPSDIVEHRLKAVEAKQVTIDEKVSKISDRVAEISERMNRVSNYLTKAQASMDEHKKKQFVEQRSKGISNPHASPRINSSSAISKVDAVSSPNITQPKAHPKGSPQSHDPPVIFKLPSRKKIEVNNSDGVVTPTGKPKPPTLPKPKIAGSKAKNATMGVVRQDKEPNTNLKLKRIKSGPSPEILTSPPAVSGDENPLPNSASSCKSNDTSSPISILASKEEKQRKFNMEALVTLKQDSQNSTFGTAPDQEMKVSPAAPKEENNGRKLSGATGKERKSSDKDTSAAPRKESKNPGRKTSDVTSEEKKVSETNTKGGKDIERKVSDAAKELDTGAAIQEEEKNRGRKISDATNEEKVSDIDAIQEEKISREAGISPTGSSPENLSRSSEDQVPPEKTLDDIDLDIADWCLQIEDELTKLYNDSILNLS